MNLLRRYLMDELGQSLGDIGHQATDLATPMSTVDVGRAQATMSEFLTFVHGADTWQSCAFATGVWEAKRGGRSQEEALANVVAKTAISHPSIKELQQVFAEGWVAGSTSHASVQALWDESRAKAQLR